MTRPGKSPRGRPLAELFAADPHAAVLRVLQQAGAALTAGELKAALRAGGVAKVDADRAWPRVQKRVKAHGHVIIEAATYRWAAQARSVSPAEALELILTSRPDAARRAELAAIVRAAVEPVSVDRVAAARQRQADIDAVRALAELAIEVEELTVNEASANAMIHRVRARVKRTGLEPIDRAGDETTFDRKRHKPIGGPIRDGAPVVVVRPGYVWKAPTEDVLLAKAVVEE